MMRFTEWLSPDHPLLKVGEIAFAHEPLRTVKGLASAYIAYPIAERLERRNIRPKLAEMRQHYRKSLKQRMATAKERLVESLLFAGDNVPYYRELFCRHAFDPNRVLADTRYLSDLPLLTKDIIREQGERMLSAPIANIRHHACKTGGTTGPASTIYYDQDGADYAAAVTLYGRERIGKTKRKTELHFASKFSDSVTPKWPSREDFKCFAMNRSNIFFDSISDEALEEIWRLIKFRRPYLVHAHPSTLYALACYVERTYGSGKAFEVFEASGELLQSFVREKIASVLQCKVIDRYGLAELGVLGYQVAADVPETMIFESECWPESRLTNTGEHELVFTGFRNRLMPLIRYATGDNAQIKQTENGFYLADVVGRIHDVVHINGQPYPTHHIKDVLRHRIGGVQGFQIDLRTNPPIMRIVLDAPDRAAETAAKLEAFWPNGFKVEFVGHDDFVRVGHRAKFRNVVTA